MGQTFLPTKGLTPSKPPKAKEENEDIITITLTK